MSSVECCRTLRMSVAASLAMSTRKRAFRVCGSLAVLTVPPGCSCLASGAGSGHGDARAGAAGSASRSGREGGGEAEPARQRPGGEGSRPSGVSMTETSRPDSDVASWSSCPGLRAGPRGSGAVQRGRGGRPCDHPDGVRAPRACLRSEGPEPFGDGGDVQGGLVADGELVVPGGDGPAALEAADAALDGVALLVFFLFEGGRPAS